MNELFGDSVFFGLFLSLFTYWIGVKIKARFQWTLLNPLLIAIVLCIVCLVAGDISYETFNQGAQYLSYLLTPATVCLALPMYRQMKVLKENWLPVLAGVLSGCAVTLGLVLLCGWFLKMEQTLTVSLLPKSITTAIAIGVTEELNGISAVTVAAVIITGIIGAVTAGTVFKLFRIKEPVAQGLACGTAAHAIGTTKALEMGEIQGAMSSLAIVASGLVTVFAAPAVASWI